MVPVISARKRRPGSAAPVEPPTSTATTRTTIGDLSRARPRTACRRSSRRATADSGNAVAADQPLDQRDRPGGDQHLTSLTLASNTQSGPTRDNTPATAAPPATRTLIG